MNTVETIFQETMMNTIEENNYKQNWLVFINNIQTPELKEKLFAIWNNFDTDPDNIYNELFSILEDIEHLNNYNDYLMVKEFLLYEKVLDTSKLMTPLESCVNFVDYIKEISDSVMDLDSVEISDDEIDNIQSHILFHYENMIESCMDKLISMKDLEDYSLDEDTPWQSCLQELKRYYIDFKDDINIYAKMELTNHLKKENKINYFDYDDESEEKTYYEI